jgi:uncharacterized glyoxalase superfamily protein PhnB
VIKQLSHVTLYVRDEDEALAFYTGPLGFEKRSDQTWGESHRWVTVAPPGAQTEIVLLRPDPIAMGLDAATRAESEIGRQGHCVFVCEDLRTTFDELSRRGVHFTKEPEQQPWGGMMAQFRDLYGNIFVLVEEPKG